MTAASPFEVELAKAFGGYVLSGSVRPGPASYDASGRRHVFIPPARTNSEAYALDVEDRVHPAPEFLHRRLSGKDCGEALRIWTEVEVVAKILGEPSLIVLDRFVKSGKMIDDKELDIEIVRLDTDTHWVAVGRKGK